MGFPSGRRKVIERTGVGQSSETWGLCLITACCSVRLELRWWWVCFPGTAVTAPIMRRFLQLQIPMQEPSDCHWVVMGCQLIGLVSPFWGAHGWEAKTITSPGLGMFFAGCVCGRCWDHASSLLEEFGRNLSIAMRSELFDV